MAPRKKGFNDYKVTGSRTIVYLETREGDIYETIIDTKNLQRLIDIDYCWHLIWEHNIQDYYVKTHVYEIKDGKRQGKTVYLAKFLMNCPKKFKVDHINHNTLLNVESNLKIVTNSVNLKNRKSANSNNTSGYRNVSLIYGWYRVQLQINGKNRLFEERFENADEAGKFAKKMRNKYYKNNE